KVKEDLGVMNEAWASFIARVRKVADRPMEQEVASSFFETLLIQKQGAGLSQRARREHEAINGLFRSAPGQDFSRAKQTLWGAVNAVTYYVDHVRAGTAGDRLENAWFGAGYALKEKTWSAASEL